jgi:hypothetical protein
MDNIPNLLIMSILCFLFANCFAHLFRDKGQNKPLATVIMWISMIGLSWIFYITERGQNTGSIIILLTLFTTGVGFLRWPAKNKKSKEIFNSIGFSLIFGCTVTLLHIAGVF